MSLRAGTSKATVARLSSMKVQVRTKDWRLIWLHFIAAALAFSYMKERRAILRAQEPGPRSSILSISNGAAASEVGRIRVWPGLVPRCAP